MSVVRGPLSVAGNTALHFGFGNRLSFLGSSERRDFYRDEDSAQLEPKVVETEKVLNGSIRALRVTDNLQPSVFNLNT
jgi:hypothetical protein